MNYLIKHEKTIDKIFITLTTLTIVSIFLTLI
jgi:hypothetical protein